MGASRLKSVRKTGTFTVAVLTYASSTAVLPYVISSEGGFICQCFAPSTSVALGSEFRGHVCDTTEKPLDLSLFTAVKIAKR